MASSRPLAHPVPYLPQTTLEAVPKYISGRTSYLRVRLAFHPYPQLIPAFCTRHGFGPSSRYHRDFNLAMGSSPGFGSNPNNTLGLMESPLQACSHSPLSEPCPKARLNNRLDWELGRQLHLRPASALLGLAFAEAPERISLNLAAQINSPAHSSIGTRSSANGGLPRLVSLRFQELFHSPHGVLFTFPSRYWFTIGGQGYLALEGGPPRFPQDFSCPVVLNNLSEVRALSPTGLSPSVVALSRNVRLEHGFLTSFPVLRPE